MCNRRAELLLAEALRHKSMAKLDTARRLEHLEVAEALAYAAERIARDDGRREGPPAAIGGESA